MASISLSTMLVEKHETSVLYLSECKPYVKTDMRLFLAREFLVWLLQHQSETRSHPYDILRGFFRQATGRSLRCATVCSVQTFGEFGAWHPLWHTIVPDYAQ